MWNHISDAKPLLFRSDIPIPIKKALGFYFPFLWGFDWGYQQALDEMSSHMTHSTIWWKEKKRSFFLFFSPNANGNHVLRDKCARGENTQTSINSYKYTEVISMQGLRLLKWKVRQISVYPQMLSYVHAHTEICKHTPATQLSFIIIAGVPADCRQTTEPADGVKGAGWSLWPISQGQSGAEPLSWLLPHQPAIGDSPMCVSVDGCVSMWPRSTPHFLWSFAFRLFVFVLCVWCVRSACVSASAQWLVIMLRRQQRSTSANHQPALHHTTSLTLSVGASQGHIISLNNRHTSERIRRLKLAIISEGTLLEKTMEMEFMRRWIFTLFQHLSL